MLPLASSRNNCDLDTRWGVGVPEHGGIGQGSIVLMHPLRVLMRTRAVPNWHEIPVRRVPIPDGLDQARLDRRDRGARSLSLYFLR